MIYNRRKLVSILTEKANKQNTNGPMSLFKSLDLVIVCLVLYDCVAIIFSYFVALLLRFDLTYSYIPEEYLLGYTNSIIPYALFCIILHAAYKLYRCVWRFASYIEMIKAIGLSIVEVVIYVLIMTISVRKMPVSYYVFGIMMQLAMIVTVRFAYIFILFLRTIRAENKDYDKRVMIIGAGAAGQAILRDIKLAKETNEKVMCLIDDDPTKLDKYIYGAQIVGGRDDIMSAAKKYSVDKIYVAIPSAPMQNIREILNICKETGCELKNLPGIYQLTSGEVTISQMKDVAVEDLLGRDTINVDMDEILEYVSDKVVLVTGGGGSIGSELCRQVASHHPKRLIVFEIYENNSYDIQQELKKDYSELNLDVIIGSVRDSRKIFQVMETYRPHIVYHAAAHKHVPLMEDSPCEAIKNNTIGTYKTAYAAMAYGCERFVLISTDKAVKPTNIMGASKRLCEMVIQAFDKKVKEGKAAEIPQLFTHHMQAHMEKDSFKESIRNTKTEFVAVRFGNVLGSNGSVIPIFKKQIAAGGPVTVTHPDIIRYFMTIQEAVSLVIQAGTYAKGGEIFIFDMGEPVKIDTLARNLIKLSGKKIDIDIKIEYSGLRPGEKLFEEKLMAEEGLEKTKNELIHIGKPIEFDIDFFLGKLEELMDTAYQNNDDNIKELVQKMVVTYRPNECKG